MAFIHYRDMDVFKKAYQVALDIHKVTAAFPKEELFGGMADQMRRASKGICANLAEGLGKGGSKIEQARYLRIAYGSAEELTVWFMFCKDLNYIDESQYNLWRDEMNQVGKMLFALIERRNGFGGKA